MAVVCNSLIKKKHSISLTVNQNILSAFERTFFFQMVNGVKNMSLCSVNIMYK